MFETKLHFACKNPKISTAIFEKILKENIGSINEKDYLGLTSLYYALENKRIDLAILLLQYGANVYSDVCDPFTGKPMQEETEETIGSLRYYITNLPVNSDSLGKNILFKICENEFLHIETLNFLFSKNLTLRVLANENKSETFQLLKSACLNEKITLDIIEILVEQRNKELKWQDENKFRFYMGHFLLFVMQNTTDHQIKTDIIKWIIKTESDSIKKFSEYYDFAFYEILSECCKPRNNTSLDLIEHVIECFLKNNNDLISYKQLNWLIRETIVTNFAKNVDKEKMENILKLLFCSSPTKMLLNAIIEDKSINNDNVIMVNLEKTFKFEKTYKLLMTIENKGIDSVSTGNALKFALFSDFQTKKDFNASQQDTKTNRNAFFASNEPYEYARRWKEKFGFNEEILKTCQNAYDEIINPNSDMVNFNKN